MSCCLEVGKENVNAAAVEKLLEHPMVLGHPGAHGETCPKLRHDDKRDVDALRFSEHTMTEKERMEELEFERRE